jgi:hypothetical protein
MSKYVECELEVTDISCLLEALLTITHPLKNKPWTERQIEVHLDSDKEEEADRLRELYPNMSIHTDGPQRLRGYGGDLRKQSANVIIRKEHVQSAANDIGFSISDAGSSAFISQFDKNNFGTKWQNGVKQEYGVAKAKKTCRRHGWKFTEERTKDGEVHLNIKGL